MITLDEARANCDPFGDSARVLYVPAGGELVEEGVITSVNQSVVFVRYEGDQSSKATYPESLTWRGVIPAGMVEVVTRYGGHRHLAVLDHLYRLPAERFFTSCLGTSSWAIRSWEAHNDHPLNLSIVEMRTLPLCPRCPWTIR